MVLAMNRRTFLKTTIAGFAGLTLGCQVNPWPEVGSSDVTIWINISEDNQITIIVNKAEMGQGASTSLPMIVAEELEADWENIKFELKPEIEPFYFGGPGFTAASSSIKTLYEPLRAVGAAAKEMLIEACAKRWQVDPESLTAENSYVIHPTRGAISYGELAAEASVLPVPENPTLKDPGEFKIIGKPLARLDTPNHIAGKSVFGTDVVVPDMLYAAVRQSPVFGGKVSNFSSLTVEGTNAEALVEFPGGVAVVAKSWWEAEKTAQSLEIEFDNPEEMEGLSSEDISQLLTQDLTKPGIEIKLAGDPLSAMEAASIKVDAAYEVPFLAHATMEPITCTAKVTSTSCEIWIPTQYPSLVQFVASMATGLDLSSVTVYPTYLGGSCGRKITPDYIIPAIFASRAVDNNNKLISWIAKNAGPEVKPAFSYSIFGFYPISYTVPNLSVHSVKSVLGVPVGTWRGVGSCQNIFFVESFIDELAYAAAEDPLEFRRKHITDSRGLAVLEKVAEMANWGHPGVSGATHGLAFNGNDVGSIVAQIAEVSVGSGGEIKVHKVYCAVDPGDVVNPDIVKAQIEGGILFGLTAALHGEITLANGRVQQSNFHDYPLLTLKNAPPVEISLIISGATMGGIGEVGVAPIAPAVTNAIFTATGQRIRKLPISRHEFS